MNSAGILGAHLRQARVLKGLTQEDLAEKLGISRVSVSHWERGISMPDETRMIDLAHILGHEVLDWAAQRATSENRSRVRVSAGRVREDSTEYGPPLRMPQGIYDLVARRLDQLREAGLPAGTLVMAERLLCGSYTGQRPSELSTLTESEWRVMVDAAWTMLATAFRLEPERESAASSSPSIERAATEAAVLRRLPALPPHEKKKGKRRA